MDEKSKKFREEYACKTKKLTLPLTSSSDMGQKIGETLKKRKEMINSVKIKTEENEK